MEAAKPWYLSKSVLAQLAAVILFLGTQFNLLPAGITHDQVLAALVVIVPMIVGIVGRLTATHQITATKAAATEINRG